MTESPADTLSRAADALEATAVEATPGPWDPGEKCVWSLASSSYPSVVDDGTFGTGGVLSVYDTYWITLMSPAVAAPLALWLRKASAFIAETVLASDEQAALDFARAILAGVGDE